MKIGLIGNMNNNNFSLMRYMRDLGADAHLLLDSTDGKGSSSHFKPECDTWCIDKWSPYIHQTTIPNAPIAAFDAPVSWLMQLYNRFSIMSGHKTTIPLQSVSRQVIRCTYKEYDYLVCSGISPAVLSRIDRKPDIFYPYASGIEFFNSPDFLKKESQLNFFSKLFFDKTRERQLNGIRDAHVCLNCDMGETKKTFDSINVNFLPLFIPMVYCEQNRVDISSQIPSSMSSIINQIGSKRIFFHSARVMFEKPPAIPETDWAFHLSNKNTDVVLKSFAELIKIMPSSQVHLLIIEYGPDVEEAKSLVSKLGICEHVTWLPKMQRREVMWFLSKADLVFGEYVRSHGLLWGGTGWEALASGKALIQGNFFEKSDFLNTYGCPMPPMLSVRCDEDILRHLIFAVEYPETLKQIGNDAKVWFDRYQGSGLARKCLDLLTCRSQENRPGVA